MNCRGIASKLGWMLALLGCGISLSYAASPLTWRQAVDIGLKGNVEIRKAQTRLEEAAGTKFRSYAAVSPRVGAQALPIPPLVSLNINQPLYRRESLPLLRQGRAAATAAEANLQLEILKFVVEARLAFIEVLFRQEDVKLKKEFATLLKAQLDLLPSFFEAGRIRRSDIESMKVRHSLALEDLQRSEDEHDIALTHFVDLLGTERAHQVLENGVIGMLGAGMPKNLELNRLVALAMKDRQDLKLLKELENLDQEEVYVAAGEFYPRVTAFAFGEFRSETPTFFKSLDTRRKDSNEDEEIEESRALAGIDLSWRLIDFGKVSGKKHAAHARLMARKEMRQKIETDIPGQVTAAYTSYIKNGEVYDNLKKSDLAVRNSEAVKEAFLKNQVSQLQVFMADRDTFLLRRAELSALYSLEQARSRLYAATGQLVKCIEGEDGVH